MVVFFVVVASMVIAAVALVAIPLSRSGRVLEDHRDRQNVAIARERLAQLDGQVAAGQVAPDTAAQERTEIELALLEDVAGHETETAAPAGRGKWAGLAVVAAVPMLAGVLYLYLGQPAALDPAQAPAAGEPAAHDGADFEGMVKVLAQRMENSPEDTEGWFVLANSYMSLNQFDEAAAAFARLRELTGDDPDLMVRHADALAMAQGGVLAGEPERLILAALEKHPDHPVALWLAGIASQRKGDLAAALGYWRRAEPLFESEPESLSELRGLIAQAERRLAGGDAAATAPESGQAAESETTPPQAAVSITVDVSLDPSLRDRVGDDDTLFVLARAVDGPPMPLAVVRRQVRDLPLRVTLDDEMAMMPAMKLSAFDRVAVIARVSKSGQAETRSGDLVGRVAPVTPGQGQRVDVVISELVP